jgi:hypothetical protein
MTFLSFLYAVVDIEKVLARFNLNGNLLGGAGAISSRMTISSPARTRHTPCGQPHFSGNPAFNDETVADVTIA